MSKIRNKVIGEPDLRIAEGVAQHETKRDTVKVAQRSKSPRNHNRSIPPLIGRDRQNHIRSDKAREKKILSEWETNAVRHTKHNNWWRQESSKKLMHKIGTLAVAALSISGSLLTGAYVLHLIGIYSLPAENLTGIKEALVFGWLILQGAVGRIVDIEKAQSDT